MGSARVQYELERTLPSLQLAAAHGLFSKDDELRSITQKRRQFENSLVRRQALTSDFVQYIQFEEELERLRVIRVTRLKDVNEIPRQDMITMQKEAISHTVSIFERGVRRLRFDLDLWKYYLDWAYRRKMRVVVSRVSARALALFPNKIELWLLVANHELNEYQSASTARALLQRGLRLNGISHRSSLAMQAEERPKKKMRRGGGGEGEAVKTLSIEATGDEDDDRAVLTIPEQEWELIRIWLGYIRMELVFLERLRRRRAVLGISQPVESADAEKNEEDGEEGAGEEQVPINNEGEGEPPSFESIKKGEQANPTPSDTLLMGAIPKSALRSAISLQSPTSLPPRSHFSFLLALSHLFREFPFYNDAEGVRTGLLDEITRAVESRFPMDSNAMLFVSAARLLDNSTQSRMLSLAEVEISEELQDGKLLKSAADLSTGSVLDIESITASVQEFTRSTDASDQGYIASLYLLRRVTTDLIAVKTAVEVAYYMKEFIESMRDRTLRLDRPMEFHFFAQLQLIHYFEAVLEERKLEHALGQYLKACSKRVLHDAKKQNCDGVDLERERWIIRLQEVGETKSDSEAREQLRKVEGGLWQSCKTKDMDERLLVLYANTLVQCSDQGALSRERVMKRWARMQSEEVARSSPRVWHVWSDWVMEDDDERWRVAQLKGAISQTISSPASHELLLQSYLSLSTTSKQWCKRADYVDQKAYPRLSLWRWAIEQVNSTGDGVLSQQDRRALLDRFFHRLTASGDNVEDYCAYLSFLMIGAGDAAKGLQVFRGALTRMAKDVSKKRLLEAEWDRICSKVRQRDEGKEDEEGDEWVEMDEDE